MKIAATRILPGADLKQSIIEFVKNQGLTAGAVISGVGSLSQIHLRLAGARPDHQPTFRRTGEFEITSLNGTVGVDGVHLHLSVADHEGNVIGGHLKDGCFINTTVELVIASDPAQRFARRPDPVTGFDEFVVE